MRMTIVLGICGENASGKTIVSDFLVRHGFAYYSLSDVIREKLNEEGKKATREALQQKGKELVKKHGMGILARIVSAYIDPNMNTVVDSIRRPEEVHELRRLPGFVLMYITAPENVRFERMKSRNRPGDPKTYEEFVKLEKQEFYGVGDTGQSIKLVSKLADVVIRNDSSLSDLKVKLKKIVPELIKKYSPERLEWDNYFMNIAQVVAQRSSCIKRKVGAVIVKNKQILSTGYNGTPRGITNCISGGCPRCNAFEESGKGLSNCLCSHAEENAIVQAAYNGVSIEGSSIYTTFSPCLYCSRMIINSGIREVIYNSKYSLGDAALSLLKQAGIKVRGLNSKYAR